MELKLSYYTIFTEPLNSNQDRIAFNTRKGSTTIITKTCYEQLIGLQEPDIPEEIVNEFVEKCILVPINEDELTSIITENIDHLEVKDELYEVIQPSANCQLGCYYCGQDHKKVNLNNDLVNSIVERIKNKCIEGKYKSLSIGWFGGEPLMALQQMRLITHQLKEFCEAHGFGYKGKVVTNGLSLKESIFHELVKNLGIREIEVTLDGLGEFHDQHRYTKSGENSFNLIYNNLKTIIRSEEFPYLDCGISIRCNVDRKNFNGVSPLISQLVKDGLHRRIEYFYVTNIYSWGLNDAHLKSLSKEEFAKSSIEWAIEMIKAGFNSPYDIPKRKKATCIATGGDSEMYDAYGNVYNCTEVSYSDAYKDASYVLDNLNFKVPGLSITDKPFHNWFDQVRDTEKFPCHFCKLLPVCGGACPKSWEEGNSACPPFKHNIKKLLELDYIVNHSVPSNLEKNLSKCKSELLAEQFVRV